MMPSSKWKNVCFRGWQFQNFPESCSVGRDSNFEWQDEFPYAAVTGPIVTCWSYGICVTLFFSLTTAPWSGLSSSFYRNKNKHTEHWEVCWRSQTSERIMCHWGQNKLYTSLKFFLSFKFYLELLYNWVVSNCDNPCWFYLFKNFLFYILL